MTRTLCSNSFIFSICVLLTTGATTAQESAPGTPPAAASRAEQDAATAQSIAKADEAFAREAAAGGHKEVALAKLAQEKGSHDRVKAYAARLERDHQQANEELKDWAAQKSVTLPGPAADHSASKFQGLQGAAFDRTYIDAMIQDHRKDIAAFEKEAARGADAGLRAFAEKALPTLREHLKEAQELETALTSR